MEPTSPPAPPSPSPSLSDLPTTADEHQYSCCSSNASDDFEFAPLLPRRQRSSRTESPRTAAHGTAPSSFYRTSPRPPPQRASRAPQPAAAKAAPPPTHRKLRWHEMAFGSVRVPAAMDMSEVRRRFARRRLGEGEAEAAGWTPWRLIRSLSCKGVEAAAVAAAATPVRLV